MGHTNEEKGTCDGEAHPGFNNEAWLRAEFEQNFQQLRDRDTKIIDITKFYAALVLGVVTASVALLGLENLEHPSLLVGLLLLTTCVVGETFIVWLVTFRKYFVTSARQINAIRRLYVGQLLPQQRHSILRTTDASVPRMLHIGSAHIIVMGIMTLVNAVLAAAGLFAVTLSAPTVILCVRILISILAFVMIVLINVIFISKTLKGGDSNR